MSEINANFVVSPYDVNITLESPTVEVVAEPINLLLSLGGFSGAGGNVTELQYNQAGGVLGGIPFANYANGNLTLGNVANVKILGGTNQYFLQTDGTGNLTWQAGTGNATGNGTVGGANTQIQFNDSANFGGAAGFTFDKVSNAFNSPGDGTFVGNVTANNFIGNLVGNISQLVNGNSNVVVAANGNITINSNGNANSTVTITDNTLIAQRLQVNSSNITIGGNAGSNNQGTGSIAIGEGAGKNLQGSFGVAIGYSAAIESQKAYGVAIGISAGEVNQGNYSIAIGAGAATANQHNNSILLNATGSNTQTDGANRFYVKPIRSANTGNILFYNDTTGEISYNTFTGNANVANTANTANFANFAGNITVANQPNITSLGNLTKLNASSNVEINLYYTNTISNEFTSLRLQPLAGNRAAAFLVASDNIVIGSNRILSLESQTDNACVRIVANATTLDDARIDLIPGNNYLMHGVRLGGNIFQTLGTRADFANAVYANYFIGDGGLLSNITVSSGTQIINGNSNVSVLANSNVTFNINGVANTQVFSSTGANLGNAVSANYFIGNFYGTANSATTAGTVTTNAQPNITSLGVLSSLSATGTITAQNFTALVGVFSGNGNSLTSLRAANLVGNTLASNVTISSLTTVGNLSNLTVVGNITANGDITSGNGIFVGNGSGLTNLNGANISNISNANYANFAGDVVNSSQPNITSLGSLTNLIVTGNISSGNANLGNLAIANYIQGTLTTNAQPNITSTGNLTSLSVTGNITANNVTANNFIGKLANGNTNISLTASNITFNTAGTANIVYIDSAGLFVNGILSANSSNIGPVTRPLVPGVLFSGAAFSGQTNISLDNTPWQFFNKELDGNISLNFRNPSGNLNTIITSNNVLMCTVILTKLANSNVTYSITDVTVDGSNANVNMRWDSTPDLVANGRYVYKFDIFNSANTNWDIFGYWYNTDG